MTSVEVRRGTICSFCHVTEARPGQQSCTSCHAAYMRDWRKTHPMNEEQRRKDSARSYAGNYKRKGKLIPEPCWCGETEVVMHHDDYDKPLDVVWLCRLHHRMHHRRHGYPGQEGYVSARR